MSSILDAMKRKREDEDMRSLPYRKASSRRKKQKFPLKVLIVSLSVLVGLTIIAFAGVFGIDVWKSRQSTQVQNDNSEVLLRQLRQIVKEEMSAQEPAAPVVQPTPIIVVVQPTVQPTATSVPPEPPATTAPPQPTQVPTREPKPAKPTDVPASKVDLNVQGIIWSEKKPMVIINGNLKEPGDSVDGYTIRRIEKNGIHLDGVAGIISPR